MITATRMSLTGFTQEALNTLGRAIAIFVDEQMTRNLHTHRWLDRLKKIEKDNNRPRPRKGYQSHRKSKDTAFCLSLLLTSPYVELPVPRDEETIKLIEDLIDARNAYFHDCDHRDVAFARATLEKASKLLRLIEIKEVADQIDHKRGILDKFDKGTAEIVVNFDATPHPTPILKPAEHRICVRLRGLVPAWQDNVSSVVRDSARITLVDEHVGVVDEKTLMAFSANDGVMSDWSPVRVTGSLVPPALEWKGYVTLFEVNEQRTCTLTFRSPHHGETEFTVDVPRGEVTFTRDPLFWLVHTPEFDLAGISRSTDPSDHWLLAVSRDGTLSSILDRFPRIMYAPPSVSHDATYHLLAMRRTRVAVGTSVPDETWLLDLDTKDIQWTGGNHHTLALDEDGHFLLRDGLIHAFTTDGDLRWMRPHQCAELLGVYGETLLAATEQGSLLGFNIHDPDNNWLQPLQPDGEKILFAAGDGLIASWDGFTCQVHNWKDGTIVGSVTCPRGSIRDVQVLSDTRLAMLFAPGVLTVFSLDEDTDAVLQLTG
ncbi:hypothetical protein AB0425_25600 [Actinosynnema sp. NPDC051121]